MSIICAANWPDLKEIKICEYGNGSGPVSALNLIGCFWFHKSKVVIYLNSWIANIGNFMENKLNKKRWEEYDQ